MQNNVRCPGCDAELTLPDMGVHEVQCPRCRHVFEPAKNRNANVAVTTAVPMAMPREVEEDHELFAPPPHVAKTYPPVGGWFTSVFVFALCINAFVFSCYTFLLLMDLHEELDVLLAGRFFWFFHRSEDWVPLAPWPALLGFFVWVFIASRNAEHLNSVGLLP